MHTTYSVDAGNYESVVCSDAIFLEIVERLAPADWSAETVNQVYQTTGLTKAEGVRDAGIPYSMAFQAVEVAKVLSVSSEDLGTYRTWD